MTEFRLNKNLSLYTEECNKLRFKYMRLLTILNSIELSTDVERLAKMQVNQAYSKEMLVMTQEAPIIS